MHWLLDLKKSLKRKVCTGVYKLYTCQVNQSKIYLKCLSEIYLKISAKKQDLSISNAEARQLAVMKEVLYDQQQVMGEYKISYKYCLASFLISRSYVQFLEHLLSKIYTVCMFFCSCMMSYPNQTK